MAAAALFLDDSRQCMVASTSFCFSEAFTAIARNAPPRRRARPPPPCDR
jgi:hypothetical protein